MSHAKLNLVLRKNNVLFLSWSEVTAEIHYCGFLAALVWGNRYDRKAAFCLPASAPSSETYFV